MSDQHKVSCEYLEVSRSTTKPDVLNKLSRIGLDEEEAILLVKSQLPDCDVSFKEGARALAFVEFGQKKILFASNELTHEDVEKDIFYPRLQLAVVVHEIAHHVTGLAHSHDRFFTETLDTLAVLFLKNFEDIIELERTKLHKNRQFERNLTETVKNFSTMLETTLAATPVETETTEEKSEPVTLNPYEKEEKKIDTSKSVGKILQMLCPTCGKPWREVAADENDEDRIIILECGHTVYRSKMFSGTVLDFGSYKSRAGESLFKYQETNANFFARTGGRMICNDEMGLGKTPTAIAIAEFYKLVAGYFRCQEIIVGTVGSADCKLGR